jgi:hypothetical protein
VPTLTQEQRKALKRLKKSDLIKHLTHNYYKISAVFATNIREHWILRDRPRGNPHHFSMRIPKSKLFTKYGLPVYSEFETYPLDEEETEFLRPFFIIQRSSIDKAGFLDIRLRVHKLILELTTEGWIDLKYPRSFLLEDLRRLKCCDSNRFFSGPGTVSAFMKYGHPHLSTEGRTLVEHFLKWGDCGDGRTLREAWSCASTMHAAIQEMLNTRKDITRSILARAIGIEGGRRHSGAKYINPGLYYSIIKNFFNKHRTILDICPGFGSKLLAASLLDCEYTAEGDYDEMASFVGCAMGQRRAKYDLVILSDTKPLSANDALPLLGKYLNISEGVLVLVNGDESDEIQSRYTPRRVLKAQMCPNFLLKRQGYHRFLIY